MKMINKLRLLWGFLCIFIVVPGTSQTQPEAYRPDFVTQKIRIL